MKYPIFISYYTGDPYYKKCADILSNACNNLGIEIIIENIKDLGSYWKNTLQKPKFILDKLELYRDDIIWIDVDTEIKKYADCFKKWDGDLLLATHTGTLQGVKASPIGFKYSQKNINLLNEWSQICNIKISNNIIDLDHDILKYELFPLFADKISIELMIDDLDYVDFTNGRVINNKISKIKDKGESMRIVIDKNIEREKSFNILSMSNFICGKKMEA